MTKFQKAIKGFKYGIQLYPAKSGERPFSNDRMRKIFGQLCDAPTPREYIDVQMTKVEIINEIVAAVKSGQDAMCGVVCRTLKGLKPTSLICVKGLMMKEKFETRHAFRYHIIFHNYFNLYRITKLT
jgi:hypothetical protein